MENKEYLEHWRYSLLKMKSSNLEDECYKMAVDYQVKQLNDMIAKLS